MTDQSVMRGIGGAVQQSSPSYSWARASEEEPEGAEARSQGELRGGRRGWAVERGGERHGAKTQQVEPYKSCRQFWAAFHGQWVTGHMSQFACPKL